jgi:hypothetical protein
MDEIDAIIYWLSLDLNTILRAQQVIADWKFACRHFASSNCKPMVARNS